MKTEREKNPFLPNGVCAPFVEMSENNLLGFDSHLKFKHDAHQYKLQLVIVIFMKENDTYYALNYSNDPLIQG